jgi:hypothetical protein
VASGASFFCRMKTKPSAAMPNRTRTEERMTHK